MKYETGLDSGDTIEQDITLDEVISNTHFVEGNFSETATYPGSYRCKLLYIQDSNEYFITHPINQDKAIALADTIIDLNQDHNGSDVLVVFDAGNINKPIVTGIVKSLIKAKNLNSQAVSFQKGKQETLRFEADQEIVFKCGKSSITLTKAGKVLIRGAYLLSRSSGANRIKGGSVHLN